MAAAPPAVEGLWERRREREGIQAREAHNPPPHNCSSGLQAHLPPRSHKIQAQRSAQAAAQTWRGTSLSPSPSSTATQHLPCHHPREVRCSTHHDVGSYDLRIHTDRFNKEGLQQGQRTRERRTEPQTWLVICASSQGLSLPPMAKLTRPEHPLGDVTAS